MWVWVAAGGGFSLPGGGEEEDVISGGINQSTPGQFRGWGGEASSGGGGEREGGKGKGEGKLRYETMENLAKGGSIPPLPSLSVVSVQSVGGLLRLRPFFPSSSPPNPLPFLSRAEKEGEGSASTRLTDEPF